MKKQQKKLKFTKSKIAHFKTLHLFGGTDDGYVTTNPYSNNDTHEDCTETLWTCGGTDCNTMGLPRTHERNTCGRNTINATSLNNCILTTN